MRKRAIAAALTIVGASLIWAAFASAATTELTVRIEGKEKTLFEGPILTEGHDVQSASDTESRPCDGTNNSAHPEAGPTPTAASVDAMEIVGQSWDANWFPGFDDYYVTQWGPDHEDLGAFQYWGVFANGALTPLGGCQWQDRAGDEVTWIYDAFSGRKLLWLAAASDPTVAPATPRPTAYVEAGQPLTVLVEAYEGFGDEPHRAEGISVAPVITEAGTGFQTVETADPSEVTTNSEGAAEITFAEPGWHRIKAQEETGYIRSNRLDVCVEPVGGGSCDPRPADASVRVPPRYLPPTPPAPPVEPKVSPSATVPSNAISLGSTVLNTRKGTAGLDVAVPGAGAIALNGSKVVAQSAVASGGGIVKLAISPTAAARKTLKRKGKLKLAVQVSFTPTGGSMGAASRSVTLKLAPRR